MAAGTVPGQQNNAGTDLINNMLRTPRQPPAGMGLGGGGTGLAGVASTAKGDAIHVVNERKKYQEWEFVYDIKNDKTTGVGQALQQQQNMMRQQGMPGGLSPGTQTPQGVQPVPQNPRPTQ